MTLNAVEDELSDASFDPDNWLSDGRLYPPRRASRRRVEGRPDLRKFRNAAHYTYVDDAGAILIEETNGTCVFSKNSRAGTPLDKRPKSRGP